jgi:hypothetical protein
VWACLVSVFLGSFFSFVLLFFFLLIPSTTTDYEGLRVRVSFVLRVSLSISIRILGVHWGFWCFFFLLFD